MKQIAASEWLTADFQASSAGNHELHSAYNKHGYIASHGSALTPSGHADLFESPRVKAHDGEHSAPVLYRHLPDVADMHIPPHQPSCYGEARPARLRSQDGRADSGIVVHSQGDTC